MLPPGRHPDAAFEFKIMAVSNAHSGRRACSPQLSIPFSGADHVTDGCGPTGRRARTDRRQTDLRIDRRFLNPLADAVRGSQIEWVGVRHEEGAALAATGRATLTGNPAVCAGTTGPGS